MSTTDPNTTLADEQLRAAVNQIIAETSKSVAETAKLNAEKSVSWVAPIFCALAAFVIVSVHCFAAVALIKWWVLQ